MEYPHDPRTQQREIERLQKLVPALRDIPLESLIKYLDYYNADALWQMPPKEYVKAAAAAPYMPYAGDVWDQEGHKIQRADPTVLDTHSAETGLPLPKIPTRTE